MKGQNPLLELKAGPPRGLELLDICTPHKCPHDIVYKQSCCPPGPEVNVFLPAPDDRRQAGGRGGQAVCTVSTLSNFKSDVLIIP